MFHRSERLLLRPWWQDDAEALARGIGHWDIVRFLATAPWPYKCEHAQGFLAGHAQGDPLRPTFAITLPGEGVIGGVGLGPEPESDETQLGYWIAEAHRGRGYAPEAGRAILSMAQALGHTRIVSSHFADNPASGRVLRKIGFRPTGETRETYCLARDAKVPAVCFDIALSGRRPLAMSRWARRPRRA